VKDQRGTLENIIHSHAEHENAKWKLNRRGRVPLESCDSHGEKPLEISHENFGPPKKTKLNDEGGQRDTIHYNRGNVRTPTSKGGSNTHALQKGTNREGLKHVRETHEQEKRRSPQWGTSSTRYTEGKKKQVNKQKGKDTGECRKVSERKKKKKHLGQRTNQLFRAPSGVKTIGGKKRPGDKMVQSRKKSTVKSGRTK